MHADIANLLARHRRAWWRPWSCRCGAAHPCAARRTGLEGAVRERARAAVDWYPAYFAQRRGPR